MLITIVTTDVPFHSGKWKSVLICHVYPEKLSLSPSPLWQVPANLMSFEWASCPRSPQQCDDFASYCPHQSLPTCHCCLKAGGALPAASGWINHWPQGRAALQLRNAASDLFPFPHKYVGTLERMRIASRGTSVSSGLLFTCQLDLTSHYRFFLSCPCCIVN